MKSTAGIYFLPLLTLPTILTGPGRYITRCGDLVTVEVASSRKGTPMTSRTLADLPEYLRARVPVGLLAMEPEALIALMCDVVHDTLYAVDALAWDRDNLAAMVASLRAGDLDLGRAIARYDLRVGVSALVYRLLTIARNIRTEPTAATYAHAWLALRTECASTALFYTKLSRGSKVGRQRLSEATVAAVDRRLAEVVHG